MSEKPNVIMLISHDTGQYISPYGIETVDTPNCERLAAESALFENSFCTAPQCSPSRASIVTGRYPHSNGVMGLSHKDFAWSLCENEVPVAKLFGPAGYETILLGAQHETHDPNTLGFDGLDMGFSLLELPGHLNAFLDGRDGSKPFYCQIGCPETHLPWGRDSTQPDTSKGLRIPPFLKDGPKTREDMAQWQGMIKRYDTGLGRLLDLLEKRGLVEDTILVITTDHGMAMPRAKGTLYDPGIATLLFMRYPGGGWRTGARLPELVSNVDILPTLLEACGIDVPDNVQGRSFLPLLRGGEYEARDCVFAEKTFHGTYDPMRCVRTDRYKYICFFEKSTLERVPGDVMHYGMFVEWGPAVMREGRERLFDLEADPDETNDLSGDPGLEGLKKGLRTRLVDWMRATGDPLLEGPVASPYYHETMSMLKISRGQSRMSLTTP